MKKSIIFGLLTLLALTFCLGASAEVEEVTAYLSDSIIVSYHDARVPMDNAPIMYNGQLYLPANELLALLGVESQWDPALNTFSIGASAQAASGSWDFVDDFDPYQSDGEGLQVIKSSERNTIDIAGVTYTHWLRLYDSLTGTAEGYYNLGGAYTSLTFSAYYDYNGTASVEFYGDNDVLLSSASFEGYELPQQYTVDLTNVYRLKIKTEDWYVYLFDMTIQ